MMFVFFVGAFASDVPGEKFAFTCPEQCYQCCSPEWTTDIASLVGISTQRFKCILKDSGALPPRRTCNDPEARPHAQSEQTRTECELFDDEVADDLRDCSLPHPAALFAGWLWDKKGELFQLDLFGGSDSSMAQVVSSIHRHRIATKETILPLNWLGTLHPVNRESAILKSAGRARAIREAVAQGLLPAFELTSRSIEGYPLLSAFESINGFEVIKMEQGVDQDKYVAFDGNGRLYGLRWGLNEEQRDQFTVQCTESIIPDDQKAWVWGQVRALRLSFGLVSLTYAPVNIDELALTEEMKDAGGANAAVKAFMATHMELEADVRGQEARDAWEALEGGSSPHGSVERKCTTCAGESVRSDGRVDGTNASMWQPIWTNVSAVDEYSGIIAAPYASSISDGGFIRRHTPSD